jgi:Fe-S cluster biogenesis protein NfuA
MSASNMPVTEPKLAKKQLNSVVSSLRKALRSHGGNIEVVSVAAHSVSIRLTGACQHCPMAAATFKNAVEKMLLSRVKGLEEVKLAAD